MFKLPSLKRGATLLDLFSRSPETSKPLLYHAIAVTALFNL